VPPRFALPPSVDRVGVHEPLEPGVILLRGRCVGIVHVGPLRKQRLIFPPAELPPIDAYFRAVREDFREVDFVAAFGAGSPAGSSFFGS